LDILVPKQDALLAKKLLLSQGYRPQHQLPVAYEALFRHLHQSYDLMREDDQVIVELHWNVISWPMFFSSNTAFLWEHLENVSVANMTVRNFAPEDALPILCVHGAKHYWERLGWICDIAELIGTYPEIDWKRVMEQASRLGGIRMLYLGLYLAQSLLGAAVPEEIRRTTRFDPVVPALAARVRLRLFDSVDGLLWAIEQHTSYIKLENRMQDKVRCGIYLAYRLLGRVVYYVVAPRVWQPD
jgi:hypothetical protein